MPLAYRPEQLQGIGVYWEGMEGEGVEGGVKGSRTPAPPLSDLISGWDW